MKPRSAPLEKVMALAGSGALRDLAALITSQIVVKLIALLGTVVAIRALGPEELGRATQFTLISGLLYQILGLGIEIAGPQMVSAAPEEERASVALSLLLLRLRTCALVLVALPLVAAWDAWHANIALDRNQVLIALAAGIWMLVTNAGSPQFLAQGYGKVRTLVFPQVVSSLILLAGHWLFTLRYLRVDVFLLVQSAAGLAYMLLVLRKLGVSPWGWNAAIWAKCRAKIGGPEARGAWLLSIATYATNDGAVLLMGFVCTRRQLGDLNAALSLYSAAYGLLMWVSYIVYSRQLLWLRNGVSVFYQHQNKALRFAWIYALAGGGLTLLIGPFPSRLMLGRAFTTAPELFSIFCACLIFSLPSTVMSGAMSATGRNRRQAKITFVSACVAMVGYVPVVLFFGALGGAWARIAVVAGVTFFQWRAYSGFMRHIEGEAVAAEVPASPLASPSQSPPCASVELP